MAEINVFAYKRDDFFSTKIPACVDGNTATAQLRSGEIRWHRSVPFGFFDELLASLDALVQPRGPAPTLIATLGVLAHGRPGGVALNQPGANEVVDNSNLSQNLHRFQRLRAILHPRGGTVRRPLVIFLSCAAASGPAGQEFFSWMSGQMSHTRVVGFETLLTTGQMTPHGDSTTSMCVEPRIMVTSEAYDPTAGMRSQPTASVELPAEASPRGVHAVEFLDGRRLTATGGNRRGATGQNARPR